MIPWFAAVAALTQMELRRFVRTAGVIRYLLVPAWMVLPVALIALVAFLASGALDQRVAIPADAPEELALVEHLAAHQLTAIPVDDPADAFTRGEVNAAILRIERGDGLYEAKAWEAPARYRFMLTAVTLDDRVRRALFGAARDVDAAVLEHLVVAAGGDPARDVWGAAVGLTLAEDGEIESPIGDFRPGYFAGYLLWLFALTGYLLLVSGPVADRSAGVVESLLVAPVRPSAYVVARIAAVTAIQAAAAVLIYGSAYLTLSAWIPLVPAPHQIAAVAASTVLINAVYLAVGTVSPSMKTASTGAGVVWLVTTLGFAVVVGAGLPPLVPLVGLVVAESPAGWWAAAASSGLGAAAVILAVARVLDRRPQLKIGGGA